MLLTLGLIASLGAGLLFASARVSMSAKVIAAVLLIYISVFLTVLAALNDAAPK